MASGHPSTAELDALKALGTSGQFAQLERQAQALLERYPHEGWVCKALALAQSMQGKDALTALERAARLLPADPEVHANLGNLWQARGQLKEAAASYRRALAAAPDYAAAHGSLGLILRQLGQLAEAESCARRALALNPRLLPALMLLAALRADHGQFSEAEVLYRQVLAIDPDAIQAVADQVQLRRMSGEDSEWLAQARRLLDRGLPPQEESYLRYAMGKYFDDLGDCGAAFDAYRRANELMRTSRPTYDAEGMQRAVDFAVAHFTRAWFERRCSAATGASQPVFIVGMPRSGTSLAEQILASHPSVRGAGEVDFWSNAYARLARMSPALELERHTLDELARNYLEVLRGIAPDAPRIVDKMPMNFLYLPLILASLPGAKLIALRRDARDTCLSIYFQNLGPLHPYATSLQDLAHYYREYQRLMQHWHAVVPKDSLLALGYEALIGEPELWSRRMVEFIGLPWDARCLDFYATSRAVITASRWQVRQKLNRSAIGRWRHYQDHIAPLLALESGPDQPVP